MVDEHRGKKGVEQRLDARRRRRRIQERAPLLRDHVLVRERIEDAEREKRLEQKSGEPLGFDLGEVPTGSLHAEDRDLASEQVARGRLDRSVSAAVQDQVRLGSDQSRRVDTLAKSIAVRGVTLAVARDLRFTPAALHRETT